MVKSILVERPMVGRQAELALLIERLQTARDGRANIVFVGGEPGMGKTRLLEEMAAVSQRAGAVVLRGGATEGVGMPPYFPFIEAIGPFIESSPPNVLVAVSEQNAAILAAIFPEIEARLEGLPASPRFPAEQARLRLYQAVGEFLAAIPCACGQETLLLVLDDLPWADAATLDLLYHVARRQQHAPLLILAAGRRADAEHPPFDRFLHALTRLRVLTTIYLAPLCMEDIGLLAANYLGAPVDEPTGRFLHTQSEGNPFFAEELLQDWLDGGFLTQRAQHASGQAAWALTTPAPIALPPTIVSAIRQRLTRLQSAVVDQLRNAAVIGRTFSVEVLARLVQKDAEEVEELLLDAERAQLLRVDRQGTFAFVHDKIRECLYAEVSSARRGRLHRQLGLVLESTAYPDESRRLADLAFHFARSSDQTRAVLYSRQAAENALHRYAAQEAAGYCRNALDLIGRSDPGRGDLLQLLGDACLQAAEPEEAVKAYEEALAWFRAAGHPLAAAGAAHGCGLARRQMDQPREALDCLERALQILATAPEAQSETAEVLVDRADLLGVVLGRHEEAIEDGRRALGLARGQGNPRLEADTSRTTGFLLVLGNDFAGGLPLLEKTLELDIANDDPAAAIDTCAYLAQAYVWLAEIEKSRAVSRRREELARTCTQSYALSYVYTWLAFLAGAQGDWPAGDGCIRQAEDAVRSVPSSSPQAFLHQVQGYLAYQRGEYAAAERHFSDSTAIFRRNDPGETLLCLGPLGLALIALERAQEALACMAEQEELLASLPAGRLRTLSAHGCLAWMAILLGDAERAASYYDGLLACQGQYHWFLVDRILGQISMARGDWLAAERHLLSAEATARTQELRPELGRVLTAQADLELVRGGSGASLRARSSLGQAGRVFEELGISPEVRATRRRLRDLPRQPSGGASHLMPAGLTQREAQVLRLVAAGMSNRDVAQELSLSESTVAKHLTAIFNKTATDNRAGAAAFAIRHHLD